MPYIPPAEQAALQDNYLDAHEPGHLNFLITQMLIEGWKVAPKYSTIHKMYKDFVLEPDKNDALMGFYNALTNRSVTRRDIRAAAALAFFEFYRRIGQVYETIKIISNGDVYSEIAKPLVDQLDSLVKARNQPLPLIIPGGRP